MTPAVCSLTARHNSARQLKSSTPHERAHDTQLLARSRGASAERPTRFTVSCSCTALPHERSSPCLEALDQLAAALTMTTRCQYESFKQGHHHHQDIPLPQPPPRGRRINEKKGSALDRARSKNCVVIVLSVEERG